VLIKLTEVLSPGAVLSEQKFLLREVFVNPEHVVMIREEARMRQLNEEGLLPDNLNLDHQFSKITINRGQTGTEIVVVGSPDLIETKLKANKKLLRG
tara:strand:- start:1163 stop:1453 length:291 start_codon:yes stop_codon:yes gene_type:complete